MKKTKKQKFNSQRLIFFLIGMCGGIILSPAVIKLGDTYENFSPFLITFLLVLFMFLGIFLQTILHEAGHLIFGLMTGYKFLSFRIFSTVFAKINGKIQIRKMRVPGTAGQCLLSPPDMKGGKIPYKAYNMGGIIVNIIVSLISVIMAVIFRKNVILSCISYINFVVGIIIVIINLIPFKNSTNDGRNQIMVGQCPEALKSLYFMLKQNEFLTNGYRPKDIPSEYFEMPTTEYKDNYMVSDLAKQVCTRVMDLGNYENASNIIEFYLNSEFYIMPADRKMLTLDLIYCELMLRASKEKIDSLCTPDIMKIIKSPSILLNAVHCQYAYSLIYEGNFSKAENIRAKFENVTSKFLYEGMVKSIRERMDDAKKSVY